MRRLPGVLVQGTTTSCSHCQMGCEMSPQCCALSVWSQPMKGTQCTCGKAQHLRTQLLSAGNSSCDARLWQGQCPVCSQSHQQDRPCAGDACSEAAWRCICLAMQEFLQLAQYSEARRLRSAAAAKHGSCVLHKLLTVTQPVHYLSRNAICFKIQQQDCAGFSLSMAARECSAVPPHRLASRQSGLTPPGPSQPPYAWLQRDPQAPGHPGAPLQVC